MGGRGVHRFRNYSPKNSFFTVFPLLLWSFVRLAFFQLFRDWTQRKIWIETFLFNCVLWIRNWERPSEFLILLGFTPREAHHSKCFFFLVFATVGVHTSPKFKRDLYWDCVDSYFRRKFFWPIVKWRRKTWFSIEKVEWGSFSFLGVQSG